MIFTLPTCKINEVRMNRDRFPPCGGNQENMKVLLVVPHYADRISKVAQTTIGPPLGLAYLAAVLKRQNIDVNILDANALRLTDRETVDRIVQAQPGILGFSAVTPTVDQCAAIAGAARNVLPDSTIILGGPHATSVPKPTIARFPVFDLLVRGEADFRFAEIVQTIAANKSVFDHKGVTGKDSDGNIVSTDDDEQNIDIDSLPLPARELLPMHRYIGPDGGRMTTMVATRGCPHGCTYCLVPQLFNRRLRVRRPAGVVDEMEHCHTNYGTKNFNFIDDTFTTKQDWVRELCGEMIDRGIPKTMRWLCLTRVDMVDRDLLALMKAAGCYKVEFGIESGDENVLTSVDKGINAQQVKQAFGWAREVGLETLGFVILFFPDETPDSLNATRDLVFATDPDTIQVSFCTPFPGTPLEKQLQDRGLSISENWSEFIFLKAPVYQHPRFSHDEMVAWQQRLLRSFYFRPRVAFRLLRHAIARGGLVGFLRTALAATRSLLKR